MESFLVVTNPKIIARKDEIPKAIVKGDEKSLGRVGVRNMKK